MPIKEHGTRLTDNDVELQTAECHDLLKMYCGYESGMRQYEVEDVAYRKCQSQAVWGIVLPIPFLCLLGSILLGIRKKQRQLGTRFFSYAGMTFCRSLFIFCVAFSLLSLVALMTPKIISIEGPEESEYSVTDVANMYYSESWWRWGDNMKYAREQHQSKALAGTIVPLPFAFITGLVLLYQRKKKNRVVA